MLVDCHHHHHHHHQLTAYKIPIHVVCITVLFELMYILYFGADSELTLCWCFLVCVIGCTSVFVIF
jgi:hypothetical protein